MGQFLAVFFFKAILFSKKIRQNKCYWLPHSNKLYIGIIGRNVQVTKMSLRDISHHGPFTVLSVTQKPTLYRKTKGIGKKKKISSLHKKWKTLNSGLSLLETYLAFPEIDFF